MLFLQLLFGVFYHILGLHGEAAQELTGHPVFPQPGQDVAGAGQGEGEVGIIAALLDLVLCHGGRAVVGHGGSLDDDILFRRPAGHRVKHILGGYDVHHFHIGGLFQIHRPGYQGDFRTPGGGGFGDGVAHLAGGVVGEVAHRVQGLLSGTGGD